MEIKRVADSNAQTEGDAQAAQAEQTASIDALSTLGNRSESRFMPSEPAAMESGSEVLTIAPAAGEHVSTAEPAPGQDFEIANEQMFQAPAEVASVPAAAGAEGALREADAPRNTSAARFAANLKAAGVESIDYAKRLALNRAVLAASLLKAETPGASVKSYAQFTTSSLADFVGHTVKVRHVYLACCNDALNALRTSGGQQKPREFRMLS